MIRVDLENKSWGYANLDSCIECVSIRGDTLVEIAVDEYEPITVFNEDIGNLIKALQEAKKFVDSMK